MKNLKKIIVVERKGKIGCHSLGIKEVNYLY